ncbi:hypothetical protein [Kitasatospora sp. NBC_01302]|uniref:hypothetical protein n=1 Tax=Kitasatospora sp. NBC_01302 TaxID=2903575 RepID=UPI002E11E49E|nr:hypothetical protein OG294_12365 [Kitasatospora sp. NBC_01302]
MSMPLWSGLVMGGAVMTTGVATLRGWQAAGYKRPRAAGWAGLLSGLGIVMGTLLVMLGVSDGALRWWAWGIGGLLLLGLVLLVVSGPPTRFGSRARRGGDR